MEVVNIPLECAIYQKSLNSMCQTVSAQRLYFSLCDGLRRSSLVTLTEMNDSPGCWERKRTGQHGPRRFVCLSQQIQSESQVEGVPSRLASLRNLETLAFVGKGCSACFLNQIHRLKILFALERADWEVGSCGGVDEQLNFIINQATCNGCSK